MKDGCFTLPKGPPCFIQLGRFGDIIQMLPAFKAIRDRIGENPVVVVSAEYASVFEGVSYVTPWVVSLPWNTGIPAARGLAQVEYPGAAVLQFWNDEKSQFASEVTRQAQVLWCQGEQWIVDGEKYPDYGTAMWIKAGFAREDMLSLPLVFDRRDEKRESELSLRLHPIKPNLLVNWKGVSSPFAWSPDFQRAMYDLRLKFHLVDLAEIKAHRIYDLLGLYDRAVGLITVDTATLHLAPASKLPYIAFTRSDWSGSVPKGNCVLTVSYQDATKRTGEFRAVLESWVGLPTPPIKAPFATARGGGVAVFR